MTALAPLSPATVRQAERKATEKLAVSPTVTATAAIPDVRVAADVAAVRSRQQQAPLVGSLIP